MFNFEEQILEAASELKEEQNLLAETEAIASVISHWLSEQLGDIGWHYSNSNTLQKKVFKLEVAAEKALLETEELAA